MKRSVISLVIIFSLLLCYITWEIIYLDRMADYVDGQLKQFVESDDTQEMQQICQTVLNYFEQKKEIHSELIDKTEREMISVTLGKMELYLEEGEITEARVAAGEVRQHLTHITQSGIMDIIF